MVISEHNQYMAEALQLALKAKANGDVPVGAVVVKDGKIIGRGYNQREALQIATAHAEILAIDEACKNLGSWRLQGCTIYVTMEPCPMCSGAIVLARPEALVFGCNDSLWGGAGSIFNIPHHPASNPKVQVIGGVLEQECKDLIQEFFRGRRIS